MSEITITLNGESRTLPRPGSLAGLIDGLGLDPRMVVAERNRAIVRREALEQTAVEDGDQIELVHFVGGG
jgi:thiamine biosynthesis protein ThiS